MSHASPPAASSGHDLPSEPSSRTTLADPRRHRHRPADGRARRHDREHRAALGAARPRLLGRLPPVDRHRLRPRLRLAAPARWPPRRPVRPQVGVRRGPARLRRRIVGGRRRGLLRGARCGARGPGHLRRAARARGAGAAVDHLHRSRRARQGVRRLQRRRRRRRGGRAAAGRHPDRDARLALVPVRQPAVRHPCRAGRDAAAGQRGPARPRAARPAGHGDRVARALRARLWLLQLRDGVLGPSGDDRHARCRRAAAGELRGDRVARRPSAAAAARGARPHPRRRVPRRSGSRPARCSRPSCS